MNNSTKYWWLNSLGIKLPFTHRWVPDTDGPTLQFTYGGEEYQYEIHLAENGKLCIHADHDDEYGKLHVILGICHAWHELGWPTNIQNAPNNEEGC